MTIARWSALLVALFLAAACGDKKEPLTPDNPAADPLMMDAGGAAPDTPAPASSGDVGK